MEITWPKNDFKNTFGIKHVGEHISKLTNSRYFKQSHEPLATITKWHCQESKLASPAKKEKVYIRFQLYSPED